MGTEVASADLMNPYEQYYQEEGLSLIPFLKFAKGEYLFGRDDEVLAIGHKLAVAMDLLRVGWQAWGDAGPIDEAFVFLKTGHPKPKRGELHDYPTRVDKEGKPQDAWQETTLVPMRSVETGQEFLFTASSSGGRNALADLCGLYGKGMRQHPGMLPVIELGVDSYKHATYGKVHVPVFKIVNWATEAELVELFGPGAGEIPEEPTKDAPPPKQLDAPKAQDEPKKTTRF